MKTRITLRLDDRTEKALDALGSRANRGQFIRAAIHFYLDHQETLSRIEKMVSAIDNKISNLRIPEAPGWNTDTVSQDSKSGYNKQVFLNKLLSGNCIPENKQD